MQNNILKDLEVHISKDFRDTCNVEGVIFFRYYSINNKKKIPFEEKD